MSTIRTSFQLFLTIVVAFVVLRWSIKLVAAGLVLVGAAWLAFLESARPGFLDNYQRRMTSKDVIYNSEGERQ